MFLFGARRFGRIGPLGLAYTGYQLWRRLSPEQKQAIRARTGELAGRLRGRPSEATALPPPLPPSTP